MRAVDRGEAVRKPGGGGFSPVSVFRRRVPEKRADGGDRTDYRVWHFRPKEMAGVIALFAALVLAVNGLFYMRPLLLPAALPLFPPYLKLVRKARIRARQKKLNYDFRAAVNSITVSLRAGRSAENAFVEAAGDLRQTVGADADMTREFAWIAGQLRLSVPAEKLLGDFATRSGVEDIENFAAVFSAAKRSGGNMAMILRNAAETIEGRIDVAREIETTLAAKRMEQKIMIAMPAMIIVYMRLASPGFLDLMYTTELGMAVMTVCLLAYAGAVWWSARIVDIEV